jgi:hypothetical protein
MLQEPKKHHGYAREYLRQAEHEGAAGKVPGPSSNTIRRIGLEPASPAVPTATEKDHHEDDDDQKRRVVHVGLLVAER